MPKRVEKSEQEWKKLLEPQQFEVCRNAGTERAFTGKYWDCHDSGVYKCAACGEALFDAGTKYDSGSGWPSFYQPLDPTHVKERHDTSHGMARTEILCAGCDAHLGHVFSDGPRPTGRRYCMNSVSLDLERRKP